MAAHETPSDELAASSAPRSGRVTPLTMLGVVLLVTGLAGLGWVGWQYYGTNLTANDAMSRQNNELRARWAARPGGEEAVPGEAIALLRVPKLGAGFEKPIIVGVGDAQLAQGVGWFPETARPGQVGNFALAGHRITHGEPFARLLELNIGDTVEVETRNAVYVYAITQAPRDLTVDDRQTWVLDPVPGHPDQKPTEATITLTTCTDLFASPQRSIGFGRLIETRGKK